MPSSARWFNADDRWKVTLDRTAFYPTSGGQPFDTGTIGDANVLDVFEQEDGTIGHLVDRQLETNSRVRGHVDWSRRFDHMQQHTGQHLLSAAFEREAGAKTVSFHLGTSASTIDLDKELPADQIARVEDAVNGILWEDREVCVKFVTANEAAKLPLRKDPAREGELRIVEIKDYDLSACGGTHVKRTGAIGVIAIAGVERFKGGLRVEFVCGGRAVRTFRALKNSVSGSVRLLSVLPDELPSAIEKLQAAGRSQQKSQEGLYERLAAHEAASLASSGEKVGAVNVVAAAVSGWDANGLKKLASSIAATACDGRCADHNRVPGSYRRVPLPGSRARHRRSPEELDRSIRRPRRRERGDGAGRWADRRTARDSRRRARHRKLGSRTGVRRSAEFS